MSGKLPELVGSKISFPGVGVIKLFSSLPTDAAG
jgi:hypothetical protein